MTIRMSEKGKRNAKNREGFRSFVYDDHHSVFPKVAMKPGQTPKGYATTGYGFNVGKRDWWKHPYAALALEGKMTTEKADQMFEVRLLDFEKDVEGLVQDSIEAKMNQPQKDELLDFIWNIGIGHFATSTCLKVLNLGEFRAVGAQMRRWVHDDQMKELAGLVERRDQNAAPFLAA